MRVFQRSMLCGMILLLLMSSLCAQDRSLIDAFQRSLMPLPGRAMGQAAMAPAAEQPTLVLHLEFALDRSDLMPEAVQYLTALGQALTESQGLRSSIYRVEGHTCDRGNAYYNQRLSQQRAEAVVDYLVQYFKLQRQQFQIVGYGEEQPIASNATEAGRQRNRRVAIVNTLKNIALPNPDQLTLDVRVSYVRGGSIEVLPPDATLTQRDGYAIEFTANDTAFIYVCQADAATVDILFPNAAFSKASNPAVSGRRYRVPHVGKWFYLNDIKGTEHIAVIAHHSELKTPDRFCQEALKTKTQTATRGLGGVRIRTREQTTEAISQQPETHAGGAPPDFVWIQSFLHQ